MSNNLKTFALFTAFCGGAITLTYPLIFHYSTHIPQGSELAKTVPLFNVWTLQWNVTQLVQGYPHYWDAPIFAPTTGAFAFSEIQLLSGLLVTPIWLTWGPTIAYNTLVILFLTLNGWFSYWLMQQWHISHLPALLSGFLMQSLPFVAQEMGVLQLMALFGFLWLHLYLYRFLRTPTWSAAFGLGLAWPVIFFTCSYYGLFSVLFLPLVLVTFWGKQQLTINFGLKVMVSLLLAICLTAPLVIKQNKILADNAFARSSQTIANNSARLDHYFYPLNYNLLYGQILNHTNNAGLRLFPGLALLILAGVGLIHPQKATTNRAEQNGSLKIYLGGGILFAFLLSLGLNLSVAGWLPYETLRHFMPGLAQLRSPFRWAAFGQIHLVLLAGFGLHNLWGWVKNKVSSLIIVSSLIGLLGLCAVFENLALPLPLTTLPSLTTPSPWQTWLNEHTTSPRIVLLPFAQGSQVTDFEQTTIWMLTNGHLKGEMLNGYSGFFPPYHPTLRQAMLTFPATDSIITLQSYGTDYVVIDHHLPNTPSMPAVTLYLRQVYVDGANQVAIYQIMKQNY